MSCTLRKTTAFLVSALTATAACASDNPGYDRPGLGFTPAALDAGDVMWEQGLPDWVQDSGTDLYSADALLRVGLGHAFELQLGTAYNWVDARGQSDSGFSGTSLGLKYAPLASGPFSWGVLGSVTFTDGAQAFQNADNQYLLGAALNYQLDNLNALGAYLENVSSDGDNDQLIALNAGHSFSDTLGAYVEAAWIHTDAGGDGSTAGAGITWQYAPAVQLDASFRHALGGVAPEWEAGIGIGVFFDR